MNKDIISNLATHKKYIYEIFSDCPAMLEVYEKAQTYYALSNMYTTFIEDVNDFVTIIQEKEFDVEGIKVIINALSSSKNEDAYKKLVGITYNYLSAKETATN